MIWKSGLCLLLVTTVLVQGQPQYEVQVQLPIRFSYRFGDNQLANGSCCSLNETPTPNCTTPCSEIQITLCSREAHHSLTDTDITNCPLGMITTPNNEPGGLISLNATSNATTTTYPGSFHIAFKINASEGIIDQETLNIMNESINALRVQRRRGERTTVLIDMLGVVCKEGYFGPDCGCTPQDDSTGHFTCDENGTIVCLPGYQNTATNCVEEIITPEPTTDPKTISEIPTKLSTAPNDSSTVTPMSATSNVAVNTANDYTTVSVSENSADIVPIVAGGVAGGLVVLLLILIVNIVLVIVVIKIKYMNHCSNKQESHTEEDIAMRANPVYENKRFGQSEPGEQNDCYETVQ